MQGTRDGSWRTLLAIYLATLLVRGVTAYFVRQPGFTDSYYYYHVAENLYAGRGFVEDFIWNYIDAPPDVSHPSNTYWGPLASLLVVPSFWLFGASFRAAQVPMVLLSSLLPMVTYWTARYLRASHRQALIGAVFTIFSGVYLAYWTVPEGYVPFALAGAVALLASARALSGSWRWSALAGGAIALAQLARSDGLLLLLVYLCLSIYQCRRHQAGKSAWSLIIPPLTTCLSYTIVLTPWLYRNWLDFGSPMVNPGVKAIFLRDYNDMFSWGGQLDLGSYLASGAGPIITGKLLVAAVNLNVLAQAASYLLVPTVMLGLWRLRREERAQPFLTYGIALYLVMSLVFTFPGRFGSLLHSVAALLPFLMTTAALGLDVAIDQLVKHRPKLNPRTARRVFSRVAVFAQCALTIGLGTIAVREWEHRYSYALYPQAITWLAPKLAPDEPVMVLDPPAYAYFSGRPAIAVPNNGPETVVEVARRYGVRYVLLERAHVPPVDRLYRGEESRPELALRLVLQNGNRQELKIYEVN